MDILQQRDSSGRTRGFVSIATKKENKQERRTKSRFAFINQTGLSSSGHMSLRLYLHWVQFENTKNNDKNIIITWFVVHCFSSVHCTQCIVQI